MRISRLADLFKQTDDGRDQARNGDGEGDLLVHCHVITSLRRGGSRLRSPSTPILTDEKRFVHEKFVGEKKTPIRLAADFLSKYLGIVSDSKVLGSRLICG